MSGRILIVDAIPTNRMVMKVKLSAAQYEVTACENCDEADVVINQAQPDLVLINLVNQPDEGHAFCQKLRQLPETRDIPIVSVGSSATSKARFAALDAGADDVLPRPVNDALLMSRIRSLMRRRNIMQDFSLREGAQRALGFDEDPASAITPPVISVVTDQIRKSLLTVRHLQRQYGGNVRMCTAEKSLAEAQMRSTSDIYVVDVSAGILPTSKLFQLVSDLKARRETRFASLLVLLPENDVETAAMLLDLGADDVMFADAEDAELGLRIARLLEVKHLQDRQRDRVRNGLRAAVTDPLTGLYNRRYAEAYMTRLTAQSAPDGQKIGVLMLDIDHFKSINDRFGHAAGDMVLKQVAERLRLGFREHDLIARVGGEEFLIVIPQATPEFAAAAAERLRRAIATVPFDLGGLLPSVRVTVSVGVSVETAQPDCVRALGEVFANADAALYSAKTSGRDAVSLSATAA